MNGTCTTPGCVRPMKARALCGSCYGRNYQKGTLFPGSAHPYKPNAGLLKKRPIGDRRKDHAGYITIATADGVKQEHRVIMAQMIGRPLAPGENVHHINGIRDDNRPENLELWHKAQPYGQRVDDLIAYVIEHHRDAVLLALRAPMRPQIALVRVIGAETLPEPLEAS